MKMNKRLATLLTILATTGPLLSATEVEQLRKLCAEQEMQIAQLENKISQLTDSPPPQRNNVTSLPATQTQPTQKSADKTYTVKPGDSLQRIANRNNISLSALARLNGLKPNAIIHPNQKIIVSKGTAPAAAQPTAASQSSSTNNQQTYKIQPGDTLYKISRKYGVSVNQLLDSNPGIKPTSLRVGKSINITTAKRSTAVDRTPAPSLASGPSIPISNTPAPIIEKRRISKGPIKINSEITYGEFAQNYNTSTQRLNELNGLSLDSSTVLAQGSELYIPAQP